MKTLLYPKKYAMISDIIYGYMYTDKDGNCFYNPPQPIFVFLTDEKEEIRQVYPRKAGHTPNKISRRYWDKELRKSAKHPYSYLIGCRVKLYQRPQDNGRWSYRHLGE